MVIFNSYVKLPEGKSPLITINPPTPALAKAGAAPGTTAGVELLLLSFPRPFASP